MALLKVGDELVLDNDLPCRALQDLSTISLHTLVSVCVFPPSGVCQDIPDLREYQTSVKAARLRWPVYMTLHYWENGKEKQKFLSRSGMLLVKN